MKFIIVPFFMLLGYIGAVFVSSMVALLTFLWTFNAVKMMDFYRQCRKMILSEPFAQLVAFVLMVLFFLMSVLTLSIIQRF